MAPIQTWNSVTDAELIEQLKVHGIEYGPISASTRSVYIRKLERVLGVTINPAEPYQGSAFRWEEVEDDEEEDEEEDNYDYEPEPNPRVTGYNRDLRQRDPPGRAGGPEDERFSAPLQDRMTAEDVTRASASDAKSEKSSSSLCAKLVVGLIILVIILLIVLTMNSSHKNPTKYLEADN